VLPLPCRSVPLKPKTALLMSEEVFLEPILRHLLAPWGHQVVRVAHADEVPELTAGAAPGLIVLDLPAADDASLRLVQGLAISGVPLIVLSPDAQALQGQAGQGVRVLAWPPDVAALTEAIRESLGGEPSAAPGARDEPARSWLARVATAAATLLLVALAALLLAPSLGVPGAPNVLERLLAKKEEAESAGEAPLAVRLIEGEPQTFELPDEVVRQMALSHPYRVPREAAPRPLAVTGTLAFDPDALARVQSRFPGEVVALGPGTTRGQWRYGMRVKEGELLAVVWSKELGEKKSDLVDALAQLKLDQDTLKRLEELYSSTGGTSEAAVRQARRNVSAGINAVNKAKRTLLTWRLLPEEIKAVEDEAKRIIERKGKRDPEREKDWARVEVRAPINGIIVEKNVVRGHIVDTATDLFKIADMSRLAVYASVYEEDLQLLRRERDYYAEGPVPWQVHLTSDPMRRALQSPGIEKVGLIVDPNQHTALVFGQLRVGQFVTATLELPPSPGVVSVPAAALDEDGQASYVVVRPDPDKPRFQLRRVRVLRRFNGAAYVASEASPAQRAEGALPLRPGELVVTAGAVQLRAALEEAQAKASAKKGAAQ
jgi:cobalt-zinc-cadmium efflux system membrane fusion protein